MPVSLEDRIRGGLYGVAVGDALGATVEFMSQEEIRRKHGVLRDIVGGGWLNLRPGEWTDDTEMTLAVAEGIITDPCDPVPHIGHAFIRWRDTNPPDIGTTIRATFRIWDRDSLTHEQWHVAAERAHREMGGMSAGNGALMRTLPVALAYSDVDAVFRHATDIASMTHFDTRAALSCALYCLTARNLLIDTSSKLVAITTAHRALIMARPLSTDQLDYGVRDELRKLTSPSALRTESLKPTGYTVDSLVCALWAFANHETLEDTIMAAVNLGGDADTIGAIAGGLAGVYWGYEAIPDRWLEKFTPEQRARLDQAAEGLLEVRRHG